MDGCSEYRIRIQGHLPAHWSELLAGMRVECGADASSTLCGPLKDQAQLYGLLACLQNLGITLISVNREPAEPVDFAAPGRP